MGKKVIPAVYEKGIFRPLDKVDLREHERVNLMILSDEEVEEESEDFDRILEREVQMSEEIDHRLQELIEHGEGYSDQGPEKKSREGRPDVHKGTLHNKKSPF